MKWVTHHRQCVALAALLMLVGCGNDMDDLEQYVAGVKAIKSSEIEPLPEVPVYDPPQYQGGQYRSPFEPVVAEIPKIVPELVFDPNGPRPDDTRVKQPLEYFPLDSLRMVGTIETSGQRWALIRTTEPKVYRVQVGDYAGLNDGRIVVIEDEKITLIELEQTITGRWIENEVSVAVTQQDSSG